MTAGISSSIIQPYLPLLAAIAIGLLIGTQRGWAQRTFDTGRRVAGFRTFGLIGGIGGLAPDTVAAALAIGVAPVLPQAISAAPIRTICPPPRRSQAW